MIIFAIIVILDIIEEIVQLLQDNSLSQYVYDKRSNIHTRQEADSLLNLAAEQEYKPAIKTRECFKECRGE